MDIRMPRLDGIEATRRIVAAGVTGATAGLDELDAVHAGPRIIILTTFDLDEYVYAALAAGASGFLLKDVTPEHLVAAVRLVRTATRCSRRRSPAAWSPGSRHVHASLEPRVRTCPP